MAITRTCPNLVHFSQFQTDPVSGVRYTGACGWAALAAACVSATLPITETTQNAVSFMCGITRNAIAAKRSTANGVTTMKGVHDQAIAEHFTIAEPYIQFQNPIPSETLHSLLLQMAGVRPIVLMVTNGQALHATNGSHTEPGLHGHFISVLGINPSGYVCQDGDNNMIATDMPVYPWASIEAAQVAGFLMLEYAGDDTSEIALLRAQNAALQKQVGILTEQNTALQTQVTALQARIAAAQKALGG